MHRLTTFYRAPFLFRQALWVIAVLCLIPATPSTAEPPIVGEDGTVWRSYEGEARTVMTNATAAGVPTLNVAIVASASPGATDPHFTDPQTRITGSGYFASVTVINAGTTTPTLAELEAFDAVLVWSNFAFADADTLGNRLADYVDGGGGVVVAVFANSSASLGRALGGRWAAAGYHIVPPAGGTTSGSVATLGTIHDAGHPILSGVATFDGGTSSFRPTVTTLVPSATLLAEWNDGSTLVAVREDTIGARVDLGMYPPSAIALSGLWNPATDGGVLLSNALLYAAERTPLSPGDSDGDGDVDADDYAAFVACASTDPNVLAPAGCMVFDFNGDLRVDCTDWLALREVWTGTTPIPFPAVCAGIVPATSTWSLVILALLMLAAGTVIRHRRAIGQA